jgi:DNA replication protein DnaC
LELSSSDWITRNQTVLLTGPTGVGKSYIACALGNFAARHGHTVLDLRAPRLFEMLLGAKADGSHLKMLTRLAKVQLLIVDDLFLTPLGDSQRNDLLEIIEDRYHKATTVITSQCPIKDGSPASPQLQNRPERRIDQKNQEMINGLATQTTLRL